MKLTKEERQRVLEEKQRQVRARVDELNEANASYVTSITKEYAEPLVLGPNDAQSLAQALATKWPCMRVSIVFKDRMTMVCAEPIHTPLPPIPESTLFNQHMLDGYEQACANRDRTWPRHAVMQAYAVGFNDAARELVRLKEENARLRPSGSLLDFASRWGAEVAR